MWRFKLPALAAALIILIIGVIFSLNLRNQFSTPNLDTQITPVPIPHSVENLTGTDQFIADLESFLDQFPGEFGLEVFEFETGKRFGINTQKKFHAASTAKILVAVYAFSQIEAGKLEAVTKVGEYDLITQVKFMVNISSNEAWELLQDFLGLKNLQKYSLSLGMTNSSVYGNTTTAADLNTLLVKLYAGEILKTELKDQLFSFMQNTEEERRIPAALGAGTTLYHRSGTYADGVHDAAIIIGPAGPFALSILSASKDSFDQAAVLRQITKKVWEFENLRE